MNSCGKNTLLTGLPRSGTTLTCFLLNKLPNSVALHEPMQPAELASTPPSELPEKIAGFFETQRRMILTKGIATSKSENGIVPANPLGDTREDGTRASLLNGNVIEVRNVDRSDFHLFMKHPSFFTACLPTLVGKMDCFAVIRNPLSVLLSWRNSGMAVAQGRAPMAELFDQSLARALASEPDALRRQLTLLDFFFDRFARFLPGKVIRYEHVIASNGRALSAVNPAAATLDEPLESRNRLAIGSDHSAHVIADILLAKDSACWKFYDREEVQRLLMTG